MSYKAFLSSNYSHHILSDREALVCKKRNIKLKRTPEEFVRQALIHYLLDELNIEIEDIEVEKYLGKNIPDYARRADVLVKSENKYLMVIECKAPNEPLTDEVMQDQAEDYAKTTGFPPVVWLTNGIENRFFGLVVDTKKYRELEILPDLNTTKGQFELVYKKRDFKPWKSPSLEQLFDENYQNIFFKSSNFEYQTRWFSPDIPKFESIPAIIRLGEALFFSPKVERGFELQNYVVEEDLGVSTRKYTNPSSYPFVEEFRSFKLKKLSNNQTLLAHLGLILSYNKPKLAVSVKDKGRLDLEMDIYENVSIDLSHNAQLFHSGKINMGKRYIETSFDDFIASNNVLLSRANGHFHFDFSLSAFPKLDSNIWAKFLNDVIAFAEAVADFKVLNKQAKPKAIAVKSKVAKTQTPLANARRLFDLGKYEDALNQINESVNKVKDSRSHWDLAYDIYWVLADYENALQCLYKIVSVKPRLISNYAYEIAYSVKALGKIQDGIDILKRIEQHELCAPYWLLIGLQQMENANWLEVKLAFQTAFDIDNKYHAALAMLLSIVLEEYRIEPIQRLLNQVDITCLEFTDELESVFLAYIVLGKYTELENLLNGEIKQTIVPHLTYRFLGDLCFLRNDLEFALSFYLKSSELNQNDFHVKYNISLLSIRLNRANEYRRFISEIDFTVIENSIGYIQYAAFAEALGQPHKRDDYLAKAAELLNHSNEYWDKHDKALLAMLNNQRAEAIEIINTVKDEGLAYGYMIAQINLYLPIFSIAPLSLA
jgi:tetratricopeptide (TPR) repeat protein